MIWLVVTDHVMVFQMLAIVASFMLADHVLLQQLSKTVM